MYPLKHKNPYKIPSIIIKMGENTIATKYFRLYLNYLFGREKGLTRLRHNMELRSLVKSPGLPLYKFDFVWRHPNPQRIGELNEAVGEESYANLIKNIGNFPKSWVETSDYNFLSDRDVKKLNYWKRDSFGLILSRLDSSPLEVEIERFIDLDSKSDKGSTLVEYGDGLLMIDLLKEELKYRRKA